MDTSIFPIGMNKHIGFCVIAAVFFILQFIRNKYWYELVLAAAVLCSLLVYVSDSPAWFYGVGILEAVLLIAAIVVYFIQYRKIRKQEKIQASLDAAMENHV